MTDQAGPGAPPPPVILNFPIPPAPAAAAPNAPATPAAPAPLAVPTVTVMGPINIDGQTFPDPEPIQVHDYVPHGGVPEAPVTVVDRLLWPFLPLMRWLGIEEERGWASWLVETLWIDCPKCFGLRFALLGAMVATMLGAIGVALGIWLAT